MTGGAISMSIVMFIGHRPQSMDGFDEKDPK